MFTVNPLPRARSYYRFALSAGSGLGRQFLHIVHSFHQRLINILPPGCFPVCRLRIDGERPQREMRLAVQDRQLELRLAFLDAEEQLKYQVGVSRTGNKLYRPQLFIDA